jgi:FdhD protein
VALKGLCATGWVVSSSPASHGAVGRLRGSAARVWLQEDWEEVKRYRHPYRKAKADPKGVMPWRILRLTEQGRRAVDGGIVIEEPLEIRLDGRTVAVLMRSPGMEKELAAGFCLGEGLVAGLGDIALIRHCGRAVPDELANDDPLDESRNRVDVTLMAGVAGGPKREDAVQLIRSGCGRTDVQTLAENLAPVDSDVRVQVGVLPHLPAQITRQQAAYREAGGIHAAALFDVEGRAIVVCEDIGRHNAVDKAVGYSVLRGIPLHDKLLVSTGRASYDMVAKGVRLGMPIMASISSPTSLAVELAEALNCTLLGYLRGKTVNIYTHGWRIAADQDSGREANDDG